MLCTSAISYAPSFDEAAGELAEQVRKGLKNRRPDLVVLFISAHHSPCYARVPDKIYNALGARVLIGTSGNHVSGNGLELDGSPGISLFACSVPNADIRPFSIERQDVPSLDEPPEAWLKLTATTDCKVDSLLLIAEPTTLNTQKVLAGLDFAFPNAHKVGGLASGITGFDGKALFLNSEVRSSGMVGVAIDGIALKSVVAQSCRPIGAPMVVTQTENNVIYKLGEQTPKEALWEIYDSADDYLKELMKQDIVLGIAGRPVLSEHFAGDFIMRNITAVGAVEGSLAIGESVHNGQVVQLHVPDPKAAKDDLARLTDDIAQQDLKESGGALMFSCLTRGKKTFGVEGYEAQKMHKALKKLPTAGVFGNGQINTRGGTAQLLGYTTTAAMLLPTPKKQEDSALRKLGLDTDADRKKSPFEARLD